MENVVHIVYWKSKIMFCSICKKIQFKKYEIFDQTSVSRNRERCLKSLFRKHWFIIVLEFKTSILRLGLKRWPTHTGDLPGQRMVRKIETIDSPTTFTSLGFVFRVTLCEILVAISDVANECIFCSMVFSNRWMTFILSTRRLNAIGNWWWNN